MDEDVVKFTFDDTANTNTRIKVIGVGGAGCNAVNRMIEAGVEGLVFAAVNTDEQALQASHAQVKLQLGMRLTSGRGAGSDPEIGREAALQDTERLIELLGDSDMVFVTAGLGGGTGTGAAPIVASLANELGALTVAVVTKPFSFEGNKRMSIAEQGLAELAETVDTVVTIPNERLIEVIDRGTSFFESFRIADDILRRAVQGISDIITIPGIINRDFADVRTIMQGMGYAVMGTAVSGGSSAAVEAARSAVSSPLLEDTSIEGARGILINVTGSSQLGLHEVHEASTIVQKAAHPEANIIFGAVLDDAMEDRVKITVIATGFHSENVRISKRVTDAAAASAAEVRPALQAAASRNKVGADSDDESKSGLDSMAVEMPSTYDESDDVQDVDVGEFSADPDDLDAPSFLRRPEKQP